MVEWLDHASFGESRWRRIDEIGEELTEFRCRTVGYLIFENKQQIILAGTLAQSEGVATGEQMILKSCIKKRRRLR